MRGDRHRLLLLLSLVVLSAVTLAAAGHDAGVRVRVLVIDETKTFASTMRVAGVVGALKGSDLFTVEIRLADVASSYDDPLAGATLTGPNVPYDLLLIFPRGLDDRSVRQVWIVSDGLDRLPPAVRAGVDFASRIIDGAFAGTAGAVDVSEDLYPGLLWAFYAQEGWIR